MESLENIQQYIRAANYLSVAQIYLKDNVLLKRPLIAEDIKPKLFGHWGTCPGINFVYAHVNYLISKHNQQAIFVLGPGHGMPALQANLFMEGTLGKYYKKATHDEKGVAYISKMFAWPYGFSSHCSPETPGLLLEGGELGYSLSSAYGAVLDNPDLLAICMIGDGEAETGALATSWHINKLVNPAKSGIVLPILHLNGLKISGPTIFGRMGKSELKKLFEGYGYEVLFAHTSHEKMATTLAYAYQQIKNIQQNARKGYVFKPRYPMIILQTPKGWTTLKTFQGKKIEGTPHAHQVVMPNVRNNEEELRGLERWLRSYHFEELFDENKGFTNTILSIVPKPSLRMGDNPNMFGKTRESLILPQSRNLAKDVKQIGQIQSNAMRMAGSYLKELFRLNQKDDHFRLFSPDETYSNRLDDVFQVTTRSWVWPIKEGDKDISATGRVTEMLSEHTIHGLAQGYVLTGRYGVITTYEAFAQIFSSMAHMYQKFIHTMQNVPWRKEIPSLTYLLTSTVWRQEHNGYSHQNPSFISGMLEKYSDFINVYFPVDDNSMLAVLEESFTAKNQMNIIVAGKTPEPRWISYKRAKEGLVDGITTWEFLSDENPHIVVVGIGDYVTKEAVAAVELIRKDLSNVRIRFVNVMRLQGARENKENPQIPQAEKYFTIDKPVVVAFHGYPHTMQSVFFHVKNPERFSIHGYREQGGTTTPFDMLVRNETDRYHIAIDIIDQLEKEGVLPQEKAKIYIQKYKKAIAIHHEYIVQYGKDPEEIETWQYNMPATLHKSGFEISHTNLFQEAKTIAVVGLSDKPDRHSYRVAKYFKEKGFRIIPVNPNVTEVLGEKAYPSLRAIPKSIHVDIVDICRKQKEVMGHMKEIADLGNMHTVWLQEGVSSQDVEDFAQDYGITMITNFCIMEAYKKITGEATS